MADVYVCSKHGESESCEQCRSESPDNQPALQPPELTMMIDELLEIHPLPWSHHLLLIKDANGNQVIHTGGLYSERGRLYEGKYLSGLNAMLVELANTRTRVDGVVATVDDLLRDAGAIVVVNEPDAGARVEIRFAELEDAQQLHKTLAEARTAAGPIAATQDELADEVQHRMDQGFMKT